MPALAEPGLCAVVPTGNDIAPVLELLSIVPSTVKLVSFNNCKLSLLHLPVITFEPFLLCANSIIPSSDPSAASRILPVIFANTVFWSASLSAENFI